MIPLDNVAVIHIPDSKVQELDRVRIILFSKSAGLTASVTGEQILLRKEVIQPQVPLRLPCYDFIPVTGHTFGVSFPEGLGRRLRVQPASMM